LNRSGARGLSVCQSFEIMCGVLPFEHGRLHCSAIERRVQARPLPDFEAPPVVEVSLGVQFEPLEGLRTPQVGLLWQEFRQDFPGIEEHPPLESVQETFGKPRVAPQISLELKELPLAPRVFFLDAEGTALIQVQQDRFIHNWRKLDDSQVYPRYDGKLRGDFIGAYTKFEQFLERENLGHPEPNQCEVTYVNIVGSDSGSPDLFKILAVLRGDGYAEEFLPDAEDVRLALRFRILGDDQSPLGRLHIAVEPAVRRSSGEMVYRLTLTARGGPLGTGLDGALRFLDLGREWVVRGFASITTPKMHELWRRRK